MRKKIVVVVGPTASGKSDLTYKIAKDLGIEIIVCDAYQVYKEISIGVNKPNIENLNSIKHHFVGDISIYDEWNIKIFKEKIENLINNNNKTFILEGGSNLYIDCLINNYNLKDLNMNLNYDNLTNEELHKKLNQLDKQEATKIPLNNRKRLIQALRIIESNNEKKSILDKQNNEQIYEVFMIRVKINRDKLYNKINERALKMFDQGWKEEVSDLLNKDEDILSLTALKAIGYYDIAFAIKNNLPINIPLIQQKTRRYAKRQETWIKNKFNPNFEFEDYSQYNELLKQVKVFLNEK